MLIRQREIKMSKRYLAVLTKGERRAKRQEWQEKKDECFYAK